MLRLLPYYDSSTSFGVCKCLDRGTRDRMHTLLRRFQWQILCELVASAWTSQFNWQSTSSQFNSCPAWHTRFESLPGLPRVTTWQLYLTNTTAIAPLTSVIAVHLARCLPSRHPEHRTASFSLNCISKWRRTLDLPELERHCRVVILLPDAKSPAALLVRIVSTGASSVSSHHTI